MTAKSFTQWGTYNQCPRKYKYRYRDKVVVSDRVKSPAAERGTEIHNTIEALFKDETNVLHPEIEENYGEFFRSLRSTYDCEPEKRWAVNSAWEPCDYKDEDCLVRGFIDLFIRMDNTSVGVYEFKTGKEWDDHAAQKHLYGTVTLISEPDIKDVSVIGVYLDEQRNRTTVYRTEMLSTYKWMWDRRLAMLDKDDICAPNPSFLCKWCDYSKDKGGPCQF